MLRFSLFLTMVAVMTTNISAAEEVNQCSADTLPIQITDEAVQPSEIILSAARVGNPDFRAFVTAVTEHIESRLAEEKLCLDSAASKERSLLQFVSWRLFTDGKDDLTASMPPHDTRPISGCRLSSPWIDLVFERKPVPSIRAIVRWNQRQLLADQAVLAGAKNVPPGVAMPLTRSDFGHFVNEYEEWEPFFFAQRVPVLQAALAKANSPRSHQPVEKPPPLEERIPPDMLWLLQRAGGGRGPFIGLVNASMNKATAKGAAGYTKLVIALIDRCFAADGADLHYNSILDAADLIPFGEYKIDTPLY